MGTDEPSSGPTPEEIEEFAARYEAAQSAEPEPEEQWINGQRVIWAPQPGSQVEFLSCPLFEALYHGTRGPGKSDALLMDYAQDVGRGYGRHWRGVIFRQTYPQLADLVAKSEKWFRRIFPRAKLVRSMPIQWRFPDGESLMLSYLKSPSDYWNWHGQELPWIGFDELTTWATDDCYRMMFSCCRSPRRGMPRKVRSTTNPYGVGSQWVKQRFNLTGRWRETQVIIDAKEADGTTSRPRAAIHGHIDENRVLLAADPHYKQGIAASAQNQAMADAWLEGSWDFTLGGMFSDVWSQEHNNLPRFTVPKAWRIDRAFDWGSSAPFSVGWYAVSDGGDLRLSDGRVMATVRGDVFRVREWYGWTGRPNQGLRILATDIAEGIVERELAWRWRQGAETRVRPGPADASIFKVENGMCIATDMQKPVRINGEVYRGVQWVPADKGPGSRKNGWEIMRTMIRNAQPKGGLPREQPGLFVVGEECPQFLRTVLSLPRDEKDLDDVDTDAEDHVADEVRYRVRHQGRTAGAGTTTGMW